MQNVYPVLSMQVRPLQESRHRSPAKKKEGFNFIETTRKLKKKTPPFNESDYYLMLQDSFENLEVNYPEVFTGNFPWEKNYREY